MSLEKQNAIKMILLSKKISVASDEALVRSEQLLETGRVKFSVCMRVGVFLCVQQQQQQRRE